MRFFIVKKKKVFIFLLCIAILVISCSAFFSVRPASSPKITHSIVIDAGHGGRDGGATGKNTGVTESELNLKYAKQLEKLCVEYGMKTVMTRSDMEGLYDESAENKKKSEMEKRKQIINSSGADIMISLHMNSFPIENCDGAQVFYAKGSESGFKLAKSVQNSICEEFKNARGYVTIGDYFVLNYSTIPSILIECGFLSNPNEELNLQKDEYCEKFCYSIIDGILNYFNI